MRLTSKIQKAIAKSAVLHIHQKRQECNSPFILHPYSVAFILADYTDNEDIIVAGLLHDVLEDIPGYTVDDMKGDFGDKITQIVKEVSEDSYLDNNFDKKTLWQMRKKGYLENLRNNSFESLMVCAADKIHNLNSIIGAYKEYGREVFDMFNASIDMRMWFHKEVLDILKQRLNHKIVDELEKVYIEAEYLFKKEIKDYLELYQVELK